MKISGGYHLERDTDKKYIMNLITKQVPSSSII